jgi:hypothetical protein
MYWWGVVWCGLGLGVVWWGMLSLGPVYCGGVGWGGLYSLGDRWVWVVWVWGFPLLF